MNLMHANKIQGSSNLTYKSCPFHVYSLLLAREGEYDGGNGGISCKIFPNWGDLLSFVLGLILIFSLVHVSSPLT